MPAALARRKASGATTFLVAAAFMIYGVDKSGAFQWISPAITSRSRPSRTCCRAEPVGRRLSNFSVGEFVDGRAAFWTKGGAIFCDVGGEKPALLKASRAICAKLRVNETLKNLRVSKIDPDRGFLDVRHDGLVEHLRDRLRPVSGFAVGDVVDGRVAGRKRRVGVFVDIGAECDAFLEARLLMAMKLEANATLKGLRITRIDEENRKLSVAYDQLEETIRDRWKPISSFSVGDAVDGRITGRLRRGDILIDIDAQLTALLDCPLELKKKLQVGDVLKGLRVTQADEEKPRLGVAFDGIEAFLTENKRL